MALLNYFKIKKLKKTQSERQNKRPMFESFVIKSFSEKKIRATPIFEIDIVKSYTQILGINVESFLKKYKV